MLVKLDVRLRAHTIWIQIDEPEIQKDFRHDQRLCTDILLGLIEEHRERHAKAKILAAMEGLASAVEAGLPSEFGDFTRVELDLIRDRFAALEAARKELEE